MLERRVLSPQALSLAEQLEHDRLVTANKLFDQMMRGHPNWTPAQQEAAERRYVLARKRADAITEIVVYNRGLSLFDKFVLALKSLAHPHG